MIIGLTGFKQSGKDTAGAHLVSLGFERRAFADPLRQHMYILNPLVEIVSETCQAFITAADSMEWWAGMTTDLRSLVDVEGWDVAKLLPEVRRLLQVYGTEVVRDNFGPETWVDLAMRGVSPGDDVVYTDVRFPNERDAIQQRGGFVLRILRKGAGLDGDGHASEQVLDNLDGGFINDGARADLYLAIEGWLHAARGVPRGAHADTHAVYGPSSRLGQAMLAAGESNGEMPSHHLLNWADRQETQGL